MARTVILSVADGDWNVWGQRFVKRQPLQRLQQTITPNASAATAKTAVLNAANIAGAGGVLIMSVGHGATVEGNPFEGKFELAPGGALTIAGGLIQNRFVDVFYDTRRDPKQPSDLENDVKNNPKGQFLANFRVYQDLSAKIKAIGLLRIVLLTCKIGNSTEFLRKVANDWGTGIQAYRKRVAIQDFVGTGSFAGSTIRLVGLEGSIATMSSPANLIVLQEEEIPFDPPQTFIVGPPIATP